MVAPIYHAKDYCLEKYIRHVEAFTYTNYDHIMVDNSSDEHDWFFKKLQFLLGDKAFKVERGSSSRSAINNAMNFARNYFIKHKYDYMLVVESDLFPEPDTIDRLLGFNKAIVGGFYLLGHAADDPLYYKAVELARARMINKATYQEVVKGLQPRRACVFELDRKPNGQLGTKNIGIDRTLDYFQKGLLKVHGVGLGCTLVRRDIIVRFPFWTDSRFTNKHHDVYFYLDLHNAGIPVFLDSDRLIEHQPSRWESVGDM